MRNDVESNLLGEFLRLRRVGDEHALGLVPQLVHGLLAGPGHGLIGGHHNTFDFRLVMQRLEGHDKLGGRAIRVGDDIFRRKTRHRVGVDLRHDKRHIRVVAPRR